MRKTLSDEKIKKAMTVISSALDEAGIEDNEGAYAMCSMLAVFEDKGFPINHYLSCTRMNIIMEKEKHFTMS